MPYIPASNIRHASVDGRIDNCNTMLKCACNVDWECWEWSCPVLDRTCAEQICLWDNNKCLIAELNYIAYRVTSNFSGLHWSELRARNVTVVRNWIKNVTSHTDVKQEVWRSSSFRRCVAENCALQGCYPANSDSFFQTLHSTYRGPFSGFKNQFSWIQDVWDLTLIWRLLSSLVWRRVIWFKYLEEPQIYPRDGGTRVL